MGKNTSRLKITVLRRFKPEEVFNTPPVKGAPEEACDVFEDGQVFYVEEDGEMPKGFCAGAWADIRGDVQILRFNGEYPWFDESGVSVNCCTDGARPVIFKLERL